MIADHRRNLGRVGKIETLPIFPICRRDRLCFSMFDCNLVRQSLFVTSLLCTIPGGYSRHVRIGVCREGY